MQITTLKKRAAIAGTGFFAAALAAIPFAPSAAATTPAGIIGENDAVNVQTYYDCSTHTLTAEVKNKLDKEITPNIEFNKTELPEKPAGEQRSLPPPDLPDVPIKPGASHKYMHYFSGNRQTIPTWVTVDGHDPVKLDPTISCNEPVSFRVTQFSENTVVGYLTNNNSEYPQTVKLVPGLNGQEQEVTLDKNESTLVSVPFESTSGQVGVSIIVTNGPDFQSTYYIDFTKPLPPQGPGLPL